MFSTIMYPKMCCKISFVRECLLALATLMCALPSVVPRVYSKMFIMNVCFVTIVAWIWFFPCINSQIIYKATFCYNGIISLQCVPYMDYMLTIMIVRFVSCHHCCTLYLNHILYKITTYWEFASYIFQNLGTTASNTVYTPKFTIHHIVYILTWHFNTDR